MVIPERLPSSLPHNLQTHTADPGRITPTAAMVDLNKRQQPSALRANKSETFYCLKFTLEGAGDRSIGNARTSAFLFAVFARGPCIYASAGRVVVAPVVASAEFTAG